MNDKEIYNLLDDLLMSYQIVANDKDKMKLSRYYKTLNDFIIEYKTLQSNWNSLREWLEERYKITKENSSSLISKYDGSPLTRDFYEAVINIQAERKDILDKMNELEGKDKE